MGGKVKGCIAVLLLACLVLVGGVFSSTPAHAAGCYGSGCTGKDPVSMGCIAGSYEVASGDVTIIFEVGRVGTVRLYESPVCGSKWAEFTPSVDLPGYTFVEVTQDAFSWQSRGFWNPSAYHIYRSPMQGTTQWVLANTDVDAGFYTGQAAG